MSEEKEGSTYKVPLTQIIAIEPHPNADRLEIATVYGFQVVIKKDSYKVNDHVIYIPIDSILPQKLEDFLFPADSKVKLTKHRVKQIRLRKIASQGMLINPADIKAVYDFTPSSLEDDYQELLEVKKYEPPLPKFQSEMGKPGARRTKPLENPNFHKYNGLDNIKWFPTLFKEGEMVVMQEKIHGSNARAAKLPYAANTVWKKIKLFVMNLLKMKVSYEFCYGSNNVQLQERPGYTGYYGEDIYGKVFQSIDAASKIKDGETIFGEIYGSGIQKDYNYGCKEGEHKFVLFDVKVLQDDGKQRWLGPDEVIAYGKERGFDVVPEVYRGPFNLALAKEKTIGDSILAPSQKVREGVVVKALEGYSDERCSNKALKVISEAYLDGDNTDFH
ncbi:MAG TPA: RNA ligase (ATP) [Flavobacterium sp.]|jgi:RNA ligase (TIGR02306 family)|nr:RNA ligase (ATP) [Flavobacterium sp.]